MALKSIFFMRNRLLMVGILSLAPCILSAQSFLGLSNDDFGPRQSLYLDSEVYPSTRLDQELLRIVYDCRLSLEEKAEAGAPIVIQVGSVREVIEGNGNPDMEIRGRYVLQVGADVTKFVSEQRFRSDSVFLGGGSFRQAAPFLNGKANAIFSQDCIYRSVRDNKLTFTGRLAADDFLYEESLPEVNWQIRDSTKTVCGYICRLAEGDFRGREYRAWFTEAISTSVGPWKLQGLPGAILHVEESQGKMSMIAVDVMAGRGGIYRTDYPYIRVSRKQYAKLREDMRKDPGYFRASHSSRSGWTTTISADYIPTPLPRFTVLEKD